MSVAEALSNMRPKVQSINKWGRSNIRHFARQNHRKKTLVNIKDEMRLNSHD